MKGISILGSTGSIGTQTLDIIRLHPDKFEVTGLAAGTNIALLESQIREFRPKVVSCVNDSLVKDLKTRLKDFSRPIEICTDADSVAMAEGAALVVGGLPGSAGLKPTFAAVNAGKDVALATKEVLVMAGRLFMDLIAEKKVALLPVDSEQSAIFQCLQGSSHSELKRIILTASGGPFRDLPLSKMHAVTPEQALDHPRWKMGAKVTVDSATLMNKGLEVIEARWLFNVLSERIEVVIHPQSIIHSMVEFLDGSIMAQLGFTDMRIPIGYALGFPRRVESGTPDLNFPVLQELTFFEPDSLKFPLLKAAYSVLQHGDAAGIVLNAADEVAVNMFLKKKIGFGDIPGRVLDALNTIETIKIDSLDDVIAFHEHVTAALQDKWSGTVNYSGAP